MQGSFPSGEFQGQRPPYPIKVSNPTKPAVANRIDVTKILNLPKRIPEIQVLDGVPTDRNENYLVQTQTWDLGNGVTIELSLGSSVGIKRSEEVNEDTELAELIEFENKQRPPVGLFTIADGMGGQGHGDVASKLAVDTLSRTFENTAQTISQWQGDTVQETLLASVQAANKAVWEKNREEMWGMGTTLTGFAMIGDQAFPVNAGDSQTFHYNMHNGLKRVTRADNVAWDLVEAGVIGYEGFAKHPQRNQVYKALGLKQNLELNIYPPISVAQNDIMLLGCDGLWDVVSDKRIEELCGLYHYDPQALTQALIFEALRNGGPDNISVLVVKRMASSQLAPTLTPHSAFAAVETKKLPAHEQLQAGDYIRVLSPDDLQHCIVDLAEWRITNFSNGMVSAINEKTGIWKSFPLTEVIQWNPLRIEDVNVFGPDPLGALRYAVSRLPSGGLQGSDRFISSNELNAMIDAVIKDPTILEKATKSVTRSGGFREKLKEIINRMHTFRKGDPVLLQTVLFGGSIITEDGWIIDDINPNQPNVLRLMKQPQIVTTDAEYLRFSNPRTIGEIDPSRHNLNTLRHIVKYWIGNGLLGSKRFYTSKELLEFIDEAENNPNMNFSNVTDAGGFKTILRNLIKPGN